MEQFLVVRDLNSERNEMIVLRNNLKSYKANFIITESNLAERNARKAKLIEESMQEGGNKVLNVIRSFHPE